ncbi:MAG TPA: FmdB family zinc ribbon protein [Thermoanaerobaculia bacterium]
MPIYEFQCLECGRRTERLQRFEDPPLAACPHCGGEVKKLISAAAVQFKGSGWYVTDYAGRGKAKGGEGKDEKAEKADKADKADKAEKAEKADKAATGDEKAAAGPEKGVTTGSETAKSSEKAPGSAKSGGNVSSE